MKLPREILECLPEFSEFQDISLESQTAVDWFFHQYAPEISEYTFTNLFVWRLSRSIKLAVLEDHLCVLVHRDDGDMFAMPPVGHGDICALTETLFSFMENARGKPRISRVPESMANQLKAYGFSAELDLDNSDYVYLVEDLAELAGRKYDGKRNRIKKCLSECAPEYTPVTPDILDQCLQLQVEWCDVRHCEINPGLASENIAIREIFRHMARLRVFGGAIIIDGKIEAFSIGERLNEDTAVIHFEKANPAIDGLYQLINQWFCQRELVDYLYVNREQDLGIPGLRNAKQSYHPHHMENKYTVKP